MWVWPNKCRLEGPPPTPTLSLGPLPHTSLGRPLPKHGEEPGGWGVGGRGRGRVGREGPWLEGRILQLQCGGGPSKGQLGPDPHLRALRPICCRDFRPTQNFSSGNVWCVQNPNIEPDADRYQYSCLAAFDHDSEQTSAVSLHHFHWIDHLQWTPPYTLSFTEKLPTNILLVLSFQRL